MPAGQRQQPADIGREQRLRDVGDRVEPGHRRGREQRWWNGEQHVVERHRDQRLLAERDREQQRQHRKLDRKLLRRRWIEQRLEVIEEVACTAGCPCAGGHAP